MDKMGEIMMELDSGLSYFRCELEDQRLDKHLTDEKQKKLDSRMQAYREGLMSYINKYHPTPPEHRLTEQGRKKIEELLEQMCALPPDADEYDD
jgi:hypothetical protein